MNKKSILAIMIGVVITATVIPASGFNDVKTTLGPLQSDNDWDYTTNPPHMFAIPNGSIGIGTSSPQRKVHIAGASVGPDPIVYIQQTSVGRGLWVNTTNGMCGIVSEAGNHGLRVLSAGGHGIYIMDANEDGVRIKYAEDNAIHIEDANDDGIHVEHADGWAGYFNGTTFFNDSVGICTKTPESLLDISGNESIPTVSVKNEGVGTGIHLTTQNATALWIEKAKNNGIRISDINGHGIYLINIQGNGIHIRNSTQTGIYIENASNNGLHVHQANGWAAFLNGDSHISGKLGIGTTTPSYPLEVDGTEDIVACFQGRVKGEEALDQDEYVTLGQVKRMVTGLFYTPSGTSDEHGELGDITYDENYIYIKTEEGWKRSALETWSSPSTK